MAWFKTKASPEDFGQAAFQMASESLSAEAARSLGTGFADYDARSDKVGFFEREGLSLDRQKLWFRLFSHCAVQACATQFDSQIARQVTRGAVEQGFANPAQGYDFASTYALYRSALDGTHQFDPRIRHLANPGSRTPFLARDDAGVLAAKVLIETFVFKHVRDPEPFINRFQNFSSIVGASIGTTYRAMSQLLQKVKMVS
ncbi:MAG: hypothetical protein KIS68_12615 [Bauldia sp.]|nr:hypothetical protein [Bauldia sp.]